jgi:phage portal protein BeeE
MLLEEGMKLEKLGIPPNDSQFLESRQFQVPEIARWFNLPPHKLKDLTKSNFNNIESERFLM